MVIKMGPNPIGLVSLQEGILGPKSVHTQRKDHMRTL